MKLAMLGLLCLLSTAESRKLSSATFLLELSEETITSHHRLLLEQVQSVASQNERGQDFKERMENYAKLQDKLLHFASQENYAPNGSNLYMFVTDVQQLVDRTMRKAINEQFKADTEVTERARATFVACQDVLDATLIKVDPIRDGGISPDGQEHPGLKRTAISHLSCRARQNAQKLAYDKCMDVLDLMEEQRNMSCEGNWTLRYKYPGVYSTGAWSDICLIRQNPYRREEADPIQGIDLGPVDVEGYLMEMFDYFTQKGRDYDYAKELCENRTRWLKEKQLQCERDFENHGEISDACDDMQSDLDQNSCQQAIDRHEACLEYDRCYVKAEEDENIKGHEYCGSHGQEAMLQLEADTLAKIDCLLDALKDRYLPGRKAKADDCLSATHPYLSTATGLPDSVTFKLCRLRHPSRFSDNRHQCGNYRSPMNDEDMSGTYPYIVKYFRGPNFWPLKGSPDDGTDEDNAPPTNLKKCTSQCCRHPPPNPKLPHPVGLDLYNVLDLYKAHSPDLAAAMPVKSVFLPSGRLNVEALPRDLVQGVTDDALFHHMPKCGYCGSFDHSGHQTMIECAYCIGACCDPPGKFACAAKHPGEAKTCENKDGTVSLLAMQTPQVSLASIKNFKSSVTQTKHGSGKWREIMARSRQKNRARIRQAEAELEE